MNIAIPPTVDDVRKLNVGDLIFLNGTIVCARDLIHKYLYGGGKVCFPLSVIYHCEPIVKDGIVYSAGPTTSWRENIYMPKIIKDHNVRMIIGKGGMDENTLNALGEHGCVYLSAVGGAGALYAKKIIKIRENFKLKEFGPAEAFWIFDVLDFPLIVSMDTHGRSLINDVESASSSIFSKILPTL